MRAAVIVGLVGLVAAAPAVALGAAPAPSARGGVFDLWLNTERRDSPVYATLTGRFVVGGRSWLGTISLTREYGDVDAPFEGRNADGMGFAGTCRQDPAVFPEYVAGVPAGDFLRFDCSGGVDGGPSAGFELVLGPGTGPTLNVPPPRDDPLQLHRGVFRQAG